MLRIRFEPTKQEQGQFILETLRKQFRSLSKGANVLIIPDVEPGDVPDIVSKTNFLVGHLVNYLSFRILK